MVIGIGADIDSMTGGGGYQSEIDVDRRGELTDDVVFESKYQKSCVI